jgi:hypothetical protein
MRMNHLREVAVYVSETQRGHFHWTLHERILGDDQWADILTSPDYSPTWMEAFDAGCVALFKLGR